MTKLLPASTLAALAAFFLACGCAKEARTGAPTPSGAGGEQPKDTVVATWGEGKKITLGELDEHLGDELAQLEEQKYRLRRQGIDSMVLKSLVEAEAKKEGQSEEEWIKRHVEDKVPAPSEAEIEQFFDANVKPRMPDAKLEEVKSRIVDVMLQPKRQEVAREVFEKLRAQANVQVSLAEPVKPRKVVAATGPSRGPENAKVTIVEFSDFQCPYCSKASATVEEVMQAYAGKVRLVFRHYPLSFHKEAPKAAEASLCAHEQGKFWEYHDVLFKNQQKLAVPDLKEHATAVGLDAAKFGECLDSGRHGKTVQDDMAAGSKVGVSGTPAFFINGVMLSGALPLEDFRKVIDQELAAK
ncbi:MAG: thioredoxin domain-containing protein [Myxococcota bacterium]